jgi:hypothetical protein
MKNKHLFSFFTIILFAFIAFGSDDSKSSKKSKTSSGSESSSSRQSSRSSNCVGSECCISQVRTNFGNTGKQILGEDYLGNGTFGISFLDARRGETYNAKVYTDCNCAIINVNVSRMR